VDPPAFGGYTHGSKSDRERPGERAKPFAPTAPARSGFRFIKAAAADSPSREKEGAMPKRAAENGADASAKKAKKAPKNVGDDIIKLESDSEGDGIPVPVAKKAAKKEAAKLRKKIAGAFGREKDERPKVLYIGHVPHGFYEEQMRGYFSQFGEVTRLRLSRNKKTGKSKHYAFVEFKHPEVAQIVAESMNGYLLFESVLKVRTMTEAECHPEMWKGANRKFKQVPWQKKAADQHDRERSADEQKARSAALLRGERRRRKKIADAGIEYDFPGYASVGDGAGDDEGGEATEKRPSAKKTPAKRSAAAKEKAAPAKRPKTPAETTARTPAKRSTRSAKA
jgi:nucleolar protein 15